MRLTNLIAAATIVLGLAFAAQQFTNANATADEVVADAKKVYPMSYRLSDLPVWSQDGKECNPTIMMAYIKASVDANVWAASSTMAAYPRSKPSSIIVATTHANHGLISEALKGLRDSMVRADAE